MQNYIDLALRLDDMNWATLPSHGKKCFVPKWPDAGNIRPDRAQIEYWVKNATRLGLGKNTCHVFGKASPLVAVDIDVTDPVEARRIAVLAWNELGGTPLVRIGKSPKAALYYRKEGFYHGASSEYDEPRGNSVEVFATSGQMIWFGMHPDTNKPYRWLRDSPLDLSPEDVPVLKPGCLRRFLSQLPVTRDAGNRVNKPTRDLTTQLRNERSHALNPSHYMEIIDDQLSRMKSSRESKGAGTRSLTIVSVSYALTKRGLSDTEILALFEKHFEERWPREKHRLTSRARIAINSARKKQSRRR